MSSEREVEGLSERVASYLEDGFFRERPALRHSDGMQPPEETAESVFDLLTHRDFCYLSRGRSAAYRDLVVPRFLDCIRSAEPLHLFYDLGGGYHASLCPSEEGVSFEVGLGEWFALAQIAEFLGRLVPIYRHGAFFRIVIDNLCALAVNDVPVERTTHYVASFRELIATVGLSDSVGLLVESEVLDASTYLEAVRAECDGTTPAPISSQELGNVHRFLGRCCPVAEAEDRRHRYGPSGRVSDRMLGPFIDGPRLTQRATASTPCFRPFPGGDSRIQAGQVTLTQNLQGHLRPVLVTASSYPQYSLFWIDAPPSLPRLVGRIPIALPRDAEASVSYHTSAERSHFADVVQPGESALRPSLIQRVENPTSDR